MLFHSNKINTPSSHPNHNHCPSWEKVKKLIENIIQISRRAIAYIKDFFDSKTVFSSDKPIKERIVSIWSDIEDSSQLIDNDLDFTDGSYEVFEAPAHVEERNTENLNDNVNASKNDDEVAEASSHPQIEKISVKNILTKRFERRNLQILAQIKQLDDHYEEYSRLQDGVDQAFGYLGLCSNAITQASGDLKSFLEEMNGIYAITIDPKQEITALDFSNYYKYRKSLLNLQFKCMKDPKSFMEETKALDSKIAAKEKEVHTASNSSFYIFENPYQRSTRELQVLKEQRILYDDLFGQLETAEGQLDILGGFSMIYQDRSETTITDTEQTYRKLKDSQSPIPDLNKEDLEAIEQLFFSLTEPIQPDQTIHEQLLSSLGLKRKEKKVQTEQEDCVENATVQNSDAIEETNSKKSIELTKLDGCTVYQGPGLEKLFQSFFLNNLSQKGSINLAQFIFDRFIPKGINKLILSDDYKKGEIHFESMKKGEITQVSENGHKDLLHSKLIFDQKVSFSFTNDGGIQFDGNSLRIGLLIERLEHYVSKIESYWLRKAVRVALRNYITEGLQLTVAITGFSNYSDCVRLHVELVNGEKEIRGDKGFTLSGNLRYLLSSFINWCDLDKDVLNENFSHIQWEV